jgi:hypothetical protein
VSKPIVIAFLGRAGSGKSTAVSYVKEFYEATGVSFARRVKELAKLLYPFNPNQLYGTQEQKEAVVPGLGMSARQFLCRLGDGARQVIDQNVWVQPVLIDILSVATLCYPAQTIWAIEDCRYVNEAECIATDKRIQGYVIKLICPDAQSAADPNHPSEAEVDKVPQEFIYATIVARRSEGAKDLIAGIESVLSGIDALSL